MKKGKITPILGRLSISIFSFSQIMEALTYYHVSKLGIIFIITFIVSATVDVIVNNSIKFSSKVRYLFIALAIFIFTSVLSLINSQQIDLSVVRLIQFIILTIWILFIYVHRQNINFDKTLRISLCLTILSFIIILISRPDLIFGVDSSSKRLIFEGLGINAISIGIGYLLILSFFYFLKPKSKLFDYLLTSIFIIFSITFAFKSGTRSVVIGVPIALLISYVLVYRATFSVAKLSIFFVSLLLASITVLESGLIGDRILDRMFVGTSDFTENSRLAIWAHSLTWYFNNLTGSGFGTELEIFGTEGVVESHNIFISVLVQTSLIGFLFFCFMIYTLYRLVFSVRCMPLIKFLTISLFLFFILQALKGTFHQTRLFFIPIAWILLMQDIKFSSSHSISKKFC